MDGAHAGVNDKIEGLLADGRALLASGRPQDAAFLFERALLLAPADAGARAGLDAAQSATAEHDRALEERMEAAALLDRIPTPGGWFAPRRGEGEAELAAPAGSPPGRSRMLLGAVCAALLLVLGAAVAGNWDGLMRRLAQAPVPHDTSLALPEKPGPRADDQTIAASRRRLHDGDPARALRHPGAR